MAKFGFGGGGRPGQRVAYPPGDDAALQIPLRDVDKHQGTRDAQLGQLIVIERLLGIVPRLRRQMEGRSAAMQAQKATA